MVGGYNGSSTTLQCTIEAFPNAVNYWERHDGRIIQERPGKYDVTVKVKKLSLALLRLPRSP